MYAAYVQKGGLMTVTQIDLDDEYLAQTMVLANVRTKKEAVNLALKFYAEQKARAELVNSFFGSDAVRAAAEHAGRMHRLEKDNR